VRALRWWPGPGKIWVMELGTGRGWGSDLNGAPGRVASCVQVSGISSAALTQYRMMRRTRAAGRSRPHWPAGGHGRPSVLRPEVVDAKVLLTRSDVVRDRAGRGLDARPAQGPGFTGGFAFGAWSARTRRYCRRVRGRA
jgi:hypothetical protein